MPDYSVIKLKRTNKTLSQVASSTLANGEPLFVDSSEGAFLVIGNYNGGSTVANSKVVAFASSPELAESQVYFSEDSPGVYKLVDADGNEITFSGISSLVFKDNAQTTTYATFNGESQLVVYPSEIGVVGVEDKSPTSYSSSTTSDKVSTVGFTKGLLNLPVSRGYNVSTELPSSSATPLAWNTEYRLGELSGINSLSITMPTVETNASAEIRLCFYCGDDIQVTISDPSDTMELLGFSEIVSLLPGYYYEISLCYIGAFTPSGETSAKNYVSIVCKKIGL